MHGVVKKQHTHHHWLNGVTDLNSTVPDAPTQSKFTLFLCGVLE
jgi:hypothetical protein